MVDTGREFLGDVPRLMKKHVAIQRSESGNNKSQAFVERTNRKLAQRLFGHQYALEIISDDQENGYNGCWQF